MAEDTVLDTIRTVVELVPDAFNMKSARVAVVTGQKQDELWDAIYDAFGGKVAREKIDGFKAAAGTVLYFYDQDVVAGMQEQFPGYAANFPVWANQANGAAAEHLDRPARAGRGCEHPALQPGDRRCGAQLVGAPDSYVLLAQMPPGGIVAEP